MHILFVHQNYPAQFGQLAQRLVVEYGWQCTFVSQRPVETEAGDGVRRIQYQVAGGATAATHYSSERFEDAVWHAHGVYDACCAQLNDVPDLIVGHSGFGSTALLRERFDCPIINYFEYYYHGHDPSMDFRPDFPPTAAALLRARLLNAMILLDLANCDGGYSPTAFQRSLFPTEFQPKLKTIFDGVNTALWQRQSVGPLRINGRELNAATRIVTYAARGLEPMRGFDIFMKTARRIYEAYPEVFFVVVGSAESFYSGAEDNAGAESFKARVLQEGDYDLSRFCFTGHLPAPALARVLSLSDLHIYLTVPFVLSWSLFNALSCECTVLASNTAPVRELIVHEQTGLLADFFDVEGLAEQALRVLRQPAAFRSLGQAGRALIRQNYSMDVCTPRLAAYFRQMTESYQSPKIR